MGARRGDGGGGRLDRGWLDGYAKGGAWMCNNNPRAANSAAARHSDRSTGSNATTAYYVSPSLRSNVTLPFSLSLSLSPFPALLRSLLRYLRLSFSLCFSPLLSSIIRPIVPSLFNRVASVVSRFSRLAVFLVLPFSLPWPPQFAHSPPVIYMRARGTSTRNHSPRRV